MSKPVPVVADLPIAFLDQWALWGVAYLPALLEKFHLKSEDVMQVMQHDRVKSILQERKEYWRRAASAEDRIKEKARLSVEDAIPTMQGWLINDEVAVSNKLAIIQELAKLSALPTGQQVGAQTGAAMVLSIDFGDGKKVTMDSNPVIDAAEYATIDNTKALPTNEE